MRKTCQIIKTSADSFYHFVKLLGGDHGKIGMIRVDGIVLQGGHVIGTELKQHGFNPGTLTSDDQDVSTCGSSA